MYEFVNLSNYRMPRSTLVSMFLSYNHQRCSIKKGILRYFEKLTERHMCQSLVFNKVASLRLAISWKNGLWYSFFSVNFAKVLRAPILKNICKRLLLKLESVTAWKFLKVHHKLKDF